MRSNTTSSRVMFCVKFTPCVFVRESSLDGAFPGPLIPKEAYSSTQFLILIKSGGRNTSPNI